MAKYCVEKFEDAVGNEQLVYWQQDKHVHNAALITDIERLLEGRFGSTWSVRAGSYRSNLSSPPERAINLDALIGDGRISLGDPQVPQTQLSPLPPSNTNVEQTKYFTFNETGNIMICTTATKTDEIEQQVRDVFNEVTVFFAGMTKAITNTKIPGSDQYYTLYHYAALEKVLGGSGFFVHVTEEDIHYSSKSFGADFSKDLITALLGLPSGAGSLAFASGLIAAMSKTGLSISGSATGSESKVAHIVFVCEYLLGIPLISALVVYADAKQVQDTLKISPCLQISATSVSMDMHKDGYLFVTPTFIKQYAGDLDSAIDSKEYAKFVDFLEGLLKPPATLARPVIKPVIKVEEGNGHKAKVRA